MNKNTNVKQYSTTIKVVAVILLILTPIVAIASISEAIMINEVSEFDTYYRWEITDAKAEKQPDGKYLITADIKNTSAYRASISDYSIIVKYGNNNRADNEMSSRNYPSGDFYDILKYPIVPAGQTIKHRMLVSLPDGTTTVRLDYSGKAYDLEDILGEHENQVYTLKLN
ncbi:MAG: hypothetical protein K2J73_08185 [Oscillospiraceae bacterium]|nr:hypothetical protein [Oscillospiraceae bacterium]